MFSLSEMKRSLEAIFFIEILLNVNLWARERIVTGILSVSVVQKIKDTYSGGSAVAYYSLAAVYKEQPAAVSGVVYKARFANAILANYRG